MYDVRVCVVCKESSEAHINRNKFCRQGVKKAISANL